MTALARSRLVDMLADVFDRHDLGVAADALVDAAAELEEAAATERTEALFASLARLGLRRTPLRTSVEALLARAQAKPLLVASAGGALLLEVEPGRARVVDVFTGEVSWLDKGKLARRLGVSSVDAEVEAHVLDLHRPLERFAHHADVSPVRRTFSLLAADREDVVVVLVYALAVGLLGLVTPIAAQTLVTTTTFGTLLQPIVVLGLVVLVCLGASTVLRALGLRVVEHVQRRIFVRVVEDLAARIPKAHASVLEGGEAAELVNRFFDVFAIQKSLASLLVGGTEIVLTLLVGLVLLATYAPILLGLDVLLVVGLLLIVFALGRGGIHSAIEESKSKYAVAAWLEEMARHPTAFKAAGGSAFARRKVERLAALYLHARQAHFRVTYRQTVFAFALSALAVAILLGVGGFLVTTGALSLGQLVAAEIVVALVASALLKVGKHIEDFYDLVASVDKLAHLVELDLEHASGEALTSGAGPLSVTVSTADPALFGVTSLVIEAGARVAIFTDDAEGIDASDRLAHALFGLERFDGATVRVGDADVRDVSLEALRARVALVRGSETFPGTLHDNLTLGRRPRCMTARQALRRVGLERDIERHGHDLATVIDFGGRPLASSEALRLTLARALYGDPGLVVIDGTLDRLGRTARDATLDHLFGEARLATFIVVTSDPEIASRCDRTIRVAPGGTRGTDDHG